MFKDFENLISMVINVGLCVCWSLDNDGWRWYLNE